MPAPDRSKRRLVAGALLAGVALLLAACAPNAPMDYLNHPEGPYAERADRLWDIVFVVATAIFVIVQAALIYALVRFRHRPGRTARQFHGNTKVEIVLTAIPALLLAGIAVPTVSTILGLAAEPEDALEITVIGHQFWWEYRYEDSGVVTANELHIPTGRNVRFRIEGDADDVIHSFWIPRLAGKQDVVPGRVNFLHVRAEEEKVYRGQCTEFCGLSHANMRILVVAESPSEFEDWLDEQSDPAPEPTDSLAVEGQEIFEQTCTACHTVDGTPEDAQLALEGPNLADFSSRRTLAGVMMRNTDANLRRWIDDPPEVKPGVLMPDYGLSAEEIDAVVAYLRTLR